ncbi:hypothetical protein ACW95P_01725 [Candidatus Mycoplasma pogonae]
MTRKLFLEAGLNYYDKPRTAFMELRLITERILKLSFGKSNAWSIFNASQYRKHFNNSNSYQEFKKCIKVLKKIGNHATHSNPILGSKFLVESWYKIEKNLTMHQVLKYFETVIKLAKLVQKNKVLAFEKK